MQAASTTTVKEIQAAIEQLSLNEQFEILAWLGEHANAGWDREMEEDAAAGRLDHLLEEVERDAREGRTTPMPKTKEEWDRILRELNEMEQINDAKSNAAA